VLFLRGDADGNGEIDIADALTTLFHMSFANVSIPCEKAADFNDDGQIDTTDAILSLLYLFVVGAPPAEPSGVCGEDPTLDDSLSCSAFPVCEWNSLVASYGTLRTVAGTGFERQKDVNSWSDLFEGDAATDAELSRPHHTQGDEAGNLYIADKDAHGIRKITPDGIVSTIAGTNTPGDDGDEPGPATQRRLDGPNGIHVRPGDGTVYIIDTRNEKVRRVTPEGTLSTLFTVAPSLLISRGLWVSDDESLAYFSATTSVHRWTPDEGVTTYASGFGELGNLTVDPEGFLVVTDREANRVYRIPARNQIVTIAGSGRAASALGGDGHPALETAFHGVRGIWFHPLGGYFLATHEGNQLWYVDSLGSAHLFLDGCERCHAGDGEFFGTPGEKIAEVRAIALDPFGNVLITESDFGYVRIVERVR
jgi:hypothetical protein